MRLVSLGILMVLGVASEIGSTDFRSYVRQNLGGVI